jgi:pimeloyl-ACP methyl ester carboxylesterase
MVYRLRQLHLGVKSRMQHVETRGGEIALSSTGRETGPLVVFVHGNSLSRQSFRAQLSSPLADRARLVALDLPGHGDSGSAPDAGTYSIAGYGAVVREVVERLAPEDAPVLLVGHSLGGHAVLNALETPGLAGVCLFGTPPLPSAAAIPEAFVPHPAAELAFSGVLSDDQVRQLAAVFAERAEPELETWIRTTRPEARAGLGASLGDPTRPLRDEVAALRDFAGSVAILHGERDPLIDLDYLRRLEIPGLWRGEVQIVPEAGHSIQLDAPGAFERLLGAWLADRLS